MVRKTRSRGWILALVLVASLAALFAASGCAGSGGTPLKYQLEAGQSYTYDMAMTLAGSASGPGLPAEEGLIPADTSIKARMTMSVLEVKDGVATIVYHYENGEATSQGEIESIPAGSLPDTTVKIDQQGRVLSVESGGQTLPLGMGGTLDYSQIANLTGVIFPDDALAKPGDEWNSTFKFPIPGISQEVSATSKGKLVSVTEEGGRTLAKVDFSVDVPLDITLDLAAIMKEMGLAEALPSNVDLEALAFKMTIRGNESVSGSTQVDVDTGLASMFDGSVTIKMSMEITDAPADMVPADQRGPFVIDLTAGVKLTEVK